MRELGLLADDVVHEGHVVGDQPLRVVRLRNRRQDADGQRDRRGLGRIVVRLPQGSLKVHITRLGHFSPHVK